MKVKRTHLSTLLENSTYASHTKDLKFYSSPEVTELEEDGASPVQLQPMPEGLKRTVEDIIGRAAVHNTQLWREARGHSPTMAVVITFIISRLRNLESLSIPGVLATPKQDSLYEIFAFSSSSGFGSEHWTQLDNLSCICLGNEDDYEHEPSIQLVCNCYRVTKNLELTSEGRQYGEFLHSRLVQ